MKNLDKAIKSSDPYLLLSNVHIGNLKGLSDTVHKASKKVVVNAELVGGLDLDKDGILFLDRIFNVDAVFLSSSNRTNILRDAGITTIHRINLIDSLSVDNSLKIISSTSCDIIELRPAYYGIKFFNTFKNSIDREIPFFLAGFVDSKEMLQEAKDIGFSAVTTSCESLWEYKTK